MIPILYYHSVAPEPAREWYKSYLTVPLDAFEREIRRLSRSGYQFIDLDEYCDRKGRDYGQKVVCVTFDDGYRDNYVYAFPILKKYGAKATIFVSPDFVRPSEDTSLSMDDVWEGRCRYVDLESLGFLSWAEMVRMLDSGLIDIQSHTMRHTKLADSDMISDFHNPDADYLYPIANRFPEEKPFYPANPNFRRLISYGTPFFREGSSLVTREVRINPAFEEYCVDRLSGVDWDSFDYGECYRLVEEEYRRLRDTGHLVVAREAEVEYEDRAWNEISDSREVIGSHLNKSVDYICWPHGDYNAMCIDMAERAGFRYIHAVPGKGPVPENGFTRIGIAGGGALSRIRTRARIDACLNRWPFSALHGLYRWLKSLWSVDGKSGA